MIWLAIAALVIVPPMFLALALCRAAGEADRVLDEAERLWEEQP